MCRFSSGVGALGAGGGAAGARGALILPDLRNRRRWVCRIGDLPVRMHHGGLTGTLYFYFDIATLQFELGNVFFD